MGGARGEGQATAALAPSCMVPYQILKLWSTPKAKAALISNKTVI